MTPTWEPSDTGFNTHGPRNDIPPYNPEAKDHFWLIGVAYRWTPDTRYLDHENVVLISPPGCYYCQRFRTPETHDQPCPGPPQ